MSVFRAFSILLLTYACAVLVQAAPVDASQTARWLASAYLIAPQQPPAGTTVTNPAPPVPDSVAATNQVASADADGRSVHFGLAADHRRMFGEDYSSLTEVRLLLEMRKSEHHGINLFVLGAVVELDKDSRAHAAAHSPLILGWGLGYRYYFTHAHTFLRPYVAADASFLWMHWSYKDDVLSGGNTAGSDSVEGLDGYLGAGLLFGSNKSVTFFGEIGAGGGTFLGTTERELKNELFGAFGYVGVKAGMNIRF